jgi:hypothetical protein
VGKGGGCENDVDVGGREVVVAGYGKDGLMLFTKSCSGEKIKHLS